MGHCRTCEAPHGMPPARNRLEALYSDVVQQLEQLQFQNLRKSAKQYFKSTEVKGWMSFKRRKSAERMHSAFHKDPRGENAKVHERHIPPNLPKYHPHSLSHHSVDSECQAFPKYWNQNVGSSSERNLLDLSRRQERASKAGLVAVKPSRVSAKSAISSNRKAERQGNEPGNSRRSESPPQISHSSSEIGYAPHISSCRMSRPAFK